MLDYYGTLRDVGNYNENIHWKHKKEKGKHTKTYLTLNTV